MEMAIVSIALFIFALFCVISSLVFMTENKMFSKPFTNKEKWSVFVNFFLFGFSVVFDPIAVLLFIAVMVPLIPIRFIFSFIKRITNGKIGFPLKCINSIALKICDFTEKYKTIQDGFFYKAYNTANK